VFNGKKKYFERYNAIVDRDEKYQRIIRYLRCVKHPVDGMKISADLDIPYEEVDLIVQCRFSELHDLAVSGVALEEFFIIGDNIKSICTNKWYKVVKSRLKVGAKAWEKTGGVLR
jgi:hypothetical protein